MGFHSEPGRVDIGPRAGEQNAIDQIEHLADIG